MKNKIKLLYNIYKREELSITIYKKEISITNFKGNITIPIYNRFFIKNNSEIMIISFNSYCDDIRIAKFGKVGFYR